MNQTVFLEGMHCHKCAERVTRVFTALSAVQACEVVLEEKKLVLSVTEPLDEALVRETVEDLGFDFVKLEA